MPGMSSPTDLDSVDDIKSVSRQSTQSSQGSSSTLSRTESTMNEETITNILARGIFTGLARDPRVRQYHHIWGSIHPTNGVYMKVKLEESWREVLPKAEIYPIGETIEEAYWHTLIGNKRTAVNLNTTEPPRFWQHAYHIWQAMLWQRQGHVSRFTKEMTSKVLSRIHQNDTPELEEDAIHNQALRDYMQDENAAQERLNRSEQLQIPAFRNIISTLIKVHNKSRPDNEVAPGYPNDELIANLDDYDHLTDETTARLRESLSALPTAELSEDELRNRIDKAFWYDFLRVARNRQFCTTEKGYIGWVPAAAKTGDRICLLVGGQVPYVLRPHKKKKGFQFLGEAYIHGIMKGAALQTDHLRTETIDLH